MSTTEASRQGHKSLNRGLSSTERTANRARELRGKREKSLSKLHLKTMSWKRSTYTSNRNTTLSSSESEQAKKT